MTDRQPLFQLNPTNDLFETPLIADQRLDQPSDPLADAGLRLVLTPQHCQIMGLPGPVAHQSPVEAQLPADGLFVTPQQLGNRGPAVFLFLQDVNWYRSSWVSCVYTFMCAPLTWR